MAKKKKSRVSKELEALERTQRINDLIEKGVMQNQALMYSAVESRPEDESHVSELLEQKEAAAAAAAAKPRGKAAKRAKPTKRAMPKRKSGRR